jgi:hypothetical protein
MSFDDEDDASTRDAAPHVRPSPRQIYRETAPHLPSDDRRFVGKMARAAQRAIDTGKPVLTWARFRTTSGVARVKFKFHPDAVCDVLEERGAADAPLLDVDWFSLPHPSEEPDAAPTGPYVPAQRDPTGKTGGSGPPPPGGVAAAPSVTFSNLFQESTMSDEPVGRWAIEGREWLVWQNARGRYWDELARRKDGSGHEQVGAASATGREIVRWLSRDVPRCIRHDPADVAEDDLWTLANAMRKTMGWNSIGTYFDYLGSFLARPIHGEARVANRVVQDSQIRRQFTKVKKNRPVATVREWERAMAGANGEARIVTAFEWMRRPIELRRALIDEFHLDTGNPYFQIRGKGGQGEITNPQIFLTDTQIRELKWYLPYRRSLAERPGVISDTGHFLCRQLGNKRDGYRLVPVSAQYTRRLLHTVSKRPQYAFRRGALTHMADRSLREFGVIDWTSLKEAADHKSVGTTEPYVQSLLQERKMPAMMRLLDPERQ